MQLNKWGCFIILLLLQLHNAGQSAQGLQFNHFSEEHGLAPYSYWSILQDKKGYIWFGSQGKGLLKYDGYTLKLLEQDPFNKNSLGTPSALSLCNDIHGNMWVAGTGGVSKYDPHKQYFIPYWYDWYGPEHQAEISHDSEYIAALPTSDLSCVIADKQGRVWIGSSKGLCFLDSPSAKIVNLSTIIYPDTLCSLDIWCLMIDHNGLLWIGTNNGINIYDRVNKKIKLFDPGDKDYTAMSKAGNNRIGCILEDHSGTVWIGSKNKGICRYDPSTGRSKTYHHPEGDNNSLSSDDVRSLIEDSHHSIWAGTNQGISVYQPASDNFKTYLNDTSNKNSSGNIEVQNLFEDRSGAVWIGTRGGIEGFYPTAKKFLFYPYRDNGQAPLFGIFKDHSGKIFMTGFGSGVQALDPVTGNFKSYHVISKGGKFFKTHYLGAFEDADRNLWVMGEDEGLYKFDRTKRVCSTIYSKRGANKSFCMAEGPDKRLWIGTLWGGLKCYDPGTKTYSSAEKLYPSAPELKFARVIVELYYDKDGILWIAGNEGLVFLDTKTGKGRVILQDTENPKSISSNEIHCIYDDGKGKIWLGTSWGLDGFDKKTEQFVTYTAKNGLPDNTIRGILADENGNLWLSTEKGICKFTPPSFEHNQAAFRTYDRSDGLPAERFGPALKGNDGTFYFSCKVGIVAFKPGELKDNPYIPPVLITEFTVLNKLVMPNDSTKILQLPVDETKEIKLSYKQNIFAFTFTALSYIHPEKNKFAYKLEPFDKDWVYTDATKRFANYTNLDPGKYTFRVKATNNDGLWNEEGVSVKLIILPPWWQTLWFKLVCVFSGGVILYAIYYYRRQKIRDILRIRNKIASDLHDDLGATLSSISIMSELVKQQIRGQSPQARSLLEKIGNSSRQMIESVNDMVWAINPQNDNFENIIKRMRTFASEILSARDIDFHFDFDKNLEQSKLKMDMRRNFYLIFKEAVNNVAKYSGAANAFVMICNRDSHLKMTIRDDGNGFEMDRVKTGNGLINMQQRAEVMKARFNLESFPGKGTIIELEFKNE